MDSKYRLARIDFLDHADCEARNSTLVPSTVWGVIVSEDEVEIHVLKWCSFSDPAEENSETWCIAKHDLIQVEYIREESLQNRITYPKT